MQQKHRPFCSERCRLQDLARWAAGGYSVASDAITQQEELEQSELRTDAREDS
ncbi:MAG: DNA gyrase inhibitor YacG [Acidobacteria bacterium]|nr:DNA gyrase inhibitor YacG [Acidobacteriota bacterium]